MNLIDLEKFVVDAVIDFLPQQAVINLALTNFEFYKPCMRKLYRCLLIKPTTDLREDCSRKRSFQDSYFTSVQGLHGVANEEKNLKLILARLKVLNGSIRVNEELASFVETIQVFGIMNKDIERELAKLIEVTNAVVYIDDSRLRKSLKASHKFTSTIIDKEDDIEQALDEIELRHLDYERLEFKDFPRFKKIIIKRQNEEFFEFLRKNHVIIRPQQINLNLKHGASLNCMQCVDLSNLKFLQLTIGCDNEHCNCLKEYLDVISEIVNFEHLIKLCIDIDGKIVTHQKSEKDDIVIFQFVNAISEKCQKLSYLLFNFSATNLGVVEDGYEGNYLRKEKFYTHLFPEILDKFKGPRVNLVLLNFLSVLTGYEQPMNNMMWNGCKCGYCMKYLQVIDDFILFHKYFNEEEKFLKDLNNPIFLNSIVKNFLSRFLFKDFFSLLKYPVQYVSWDLHSNNFSPIPIQCFDTENYKEGDFNEDTEIFYDSQEDPKCKYKNLELFPKLSICVIHYVNDLMNNLIYLNRGNAESLKLEFENLNDGEIENKLQSLYINGFVFSFDKEMNGTNFFVNLYDNNVNQ